MSQTEQNYGSYHYLKTKDGHIGILSVIPESGQIIIRDDVRLCYTYRPTSDAENLYNFLVNRNECYNEVILYNINQKIRLDIDIDTTSSEFTSFIIPETSFIEHKRALWHKSQPPRPNKCPTCFCALTSKAVCKKCKITVEMPNQGRPISIEEIKALYILKRIVDAYKRVMMQYMDFVPDYVLCSSSRHQKYSFHLISTAYAVDAPGAHEVAMAIHNEIPEQIKPFNDTAVSGKGGHNLRMCLCIKPQKRDTKKHIIKNLFENEIQLFQETPPKTPTYNEWRESLVTYITESCILVKSVVKPSDSLNYDYHGSDQLPPEIITKVTTLFEGVSEAGKEKNRYVFMRYAPGFCPICQRTHDSDNMYVFMAHGRYFARCWRNGANLKLN